LMHATSRGFAAFGGAANGFAVCSRHGIDNVIA
jgi:hypothetical protein